MMVEKGTGIKTAADCLKEGRKLLEFAYEERGSETRISTDTEMPTATVDFLTQSHRIND